MVSVYRCDVHGQRIRGALEGIRITLLFADYRASRKLRVCPSDLTEMLRTHDEEWSVVSDEGLQAGALVCSACGDAVPSGTRLVPVFVYVWRRGLDQEERFGQYCPSCARAVEAAFSLTREDTA